MKLNFKQVLIQQNHQPYRLNDTDLTLGAAIRISVDQSLASDAALTPSEMYELGHIGALTESSDSLTAEQIGKIKDRLAKVFTAALVYQLFNALEGE
jgi:hypothetical protein